MLTKADIRKLPFYRCISTSQLVYRQCIIIWFIFANHSSEALDLSTQFSPRGVSKQSLKSLVAKMQVPLTEPPTNFQKATGNISKVTLPDLEYEIDENYDYMEINMSEIGPEVVVDLYPPEMILSHDQATSKGRKKLQKKIGFTEEEKIELLRLHNLYRSTVTPPAADMNFMEWDDHLAKIAQEWANNCKFAHGFPPNSYPGPMGQNLYCGFDPKGIRAMLLWFEEYHDYDMENLECAPEKQCGHFTQMAWSDSTLLGCGVSWCKPKRFLVVCHYSPPGNVVGLKPYLVGKPCSQCGSDDGGLCTHNLCVTKEQCEKNLETCDAECLLECHNCGALDKTTCKCHCKDGWDSLDCSRRCENQNNNCGKSGGWPTPTYCSLYHDVVGDIHCRQMCGRCNGLEDVVNSSNVCCKGMMCDEGYVIDTKDRICRCILQCPGPKCHNYSSCPGPTCHESSAPKIAQNGSSPEIAQNGSVSNVAENNVPNVLEISSGPPNSMKNMYIVVLASAILVTFLS